jgi:hypothetical protein
MARRNPLRKLTYFEPVPPRLPRNTVIESTFEVGRRFRCTMRVDDGDRVGAVGEADGARGVRAMNTAFGQLLVLERAC